MDSNRTNSTPLEEMRNQEAINDSVAGTDHLPRHSLTQKELEYLCNRGSKNTPSYVDDYVDPDIEV